VEEDGGWSLCDTRTCMGGGGGWAGHIRLSGGVGG